MPVYTVEQGDTISSIADANGFFWETLWNHARNGRLKAQRKNPNALLPGDQVFIPAKRQKKESCITDQAHYFHLKGVPVRFNVCIMNADGGARGGLPYTLVIDGKTYEGRTSQDGMISEVIGPQAREGTLTLKDALTAAR